MAEQLFIKNNNYFDKMEQNLYHKELSPLSIPAAKSVNLNPTDTIEIKKEDNHKKSFGKTAAIAIAIIGAATLLVSKGISGSTAEKIKKWTIKKQNDFLRFAAKNKTASGIEKQMFRSAKYSKKVFDLGDAIGNFTALKDTAFHKFTSWDFVNYLKFPRLQRFLKKWAPVSSWNFLNSNHPKIHKFLNKYIPLQKVCDWFTNNILKITYSAVDTKYAKAGNAFENLEAKMMTLLSEAKKKGVSKQEINRIKNNIELISSLYRQGFSKTVRNTRLENIHKGLQNLANDVSTEIAGTFKKKNSGGKGFRKIYGSYMTERFAAPTKKVHKQTIDAAKIRLSNNVSDVYSRMTTAANDLTYAFNAKDTKNRQLFGNLLELLEEFKKQSASSAYKDRNIIKTKILENLTQLKTNIGRATANGTYTKDEAKNIYDAISNIRNAAQTSKKGHVQDILTDFKKIFGENSKEYISIKTATNHTNNLFNEAIETEAGSLVSKIAEAKVGSIPTDVLALAAPTIGGAMVISKGKDKNEKIGATLKLGIPVLGFVGSYFYTASKAFSGAKNLIFGAVSTFILNRIGSGIYNYYQKRFVENKSVKQIAESAYEKVTST